ncbi:MAG: DUF4346 domain-containing protein [Myxococcales bacterium]|jgi:tetrahydromethanopterin S-methyltransferase subunit A|nr:DUF4346 domain-containing protein [Myxococcales bacterium]
MSPGDFARDAPPVGVVRARLAEATATPKCHACGCFQRTVGALEALEPAREALAGELARARRVFERERYDCLGCAVCFPAIAANASAEVWPGAEGMDLCPTDTPEEREGWPPLPGDYRVVRYVAPVAVCTLGDERLADAIALRAPEGLAIVGTMRTENLGIERVITNVLANPNIRALVLAGVDPSRPGGHLPGQSLVSLFERGVDDAGRIRGAEGRRPVLRNVARDAIDAFLRQVTLEPRIGEVDAGVIADRVRALAASAPGPFEGAPVGRAVVVEAREPRRLVADPAGYLVVYPDARRGRLLVEHYTNAGVLDCVLEGATPSALYATIVERGLVTRLDHAAYLGRELARAERALQTGEPYTQDRAAGELEEDAPEASGCGCAGGCGPR